MTCPTCGNDIENRALWTYGVWSVWSVHVEVPEHPRAGNWYVPIREAHGRTHVVRYLPQSSALLGTPEEMSDEAALSLEKWLGSVRDALPPQKPSGWSSCARDHETGPAIRGRE